MSEQVSESEPVRDTGLTLVVAGVLVGMTGAALWSTDGWPLGIGLLFVAASLWLVGGVAMGIQIGMRGTRPGH